MKKVKISFSIIYWLIILALIVIAASTALSVFKVPGGISLFSVQSGSMEPTITTGSVVLIQKQNTYKESDIITFLGTNKKDTTTHRILAIKNINGEKIFTTKGDANRGEDRETIKENQILGKVFFSAPYLGYVVSFAKTQMGFIFLIVVPAVIIIFSEILNIKKEVLKIIEKKKIPVDATKILTLLLLISGILIFSTSTKAYLSDTEKSENNTLQAGIWGTPEPTTTPTVTPTPTTSPTPSPTPTVTTTPSPSPAPPVNAGDVVINEVYYDVDASHGGNEGDDQNPDEWIELYNKTSSPVNLKNWKIVDNSGTERSISESNTDIPANGFAVLAKSASTFTHWNIPSGVEKISIGQKFGNGLANEGDRVILKDNNGNIIDQMSYGTDNTILNPSETDVTEGHSLEREPDGIDTDTNADFMDRTTPMPGS